MLDDIKKRVYAANLDLAASGVVIYTWGNVSEIDRKNGLVVIKPSGIDYEAMTPDDMAVVDLEGNLIESNRKPSSDTMTHLALYKAFPQIGGICHTHSTNAVAFAQAGIPIAALGTTHADAFYGDIPCTRELKREEVETDYEANTGDVIVETVVSGGYEVMSIPGIIVRNHGPFAWGKDAAAAVYHAVVLEKVAEMDYKSLTLRPKSSMAHYILEKHYLRKHGPGAYYGQNPGKE